MHLAKDLERALNREHLIESKQRLYYQELLHKNFSGILENLRN